MDIEEIKGFIENKIAEGTNLEYKNPAALEDNKEMAKDISAMANSNGGRIIYGLCDDDDDQIPDRIEWVNDSKKGEKIEQVVDTRIVPKIEGLKVVQIQNPDNEAEFVFVVEVPKSDRAPHQDINSKIERRYWRRNGLTTRQMEHYEVEDLFFKRKRPILRVELQTRGTVQEPIFDIDVLNEGKVIGEKVFMTLKVPNIFNIDGDCWSEDSHSEVFKRYEYHSDLQDYFYSGIINSVGRIYFPNKDNLIEAFRIIFMIICEDMKMIRGEIYWCPLELLEKTGKEFKTIIYEEDEEDNNPFVRDLWS